MATKQRIAPGFPFPVYVNETAAAQRIAPGVEVNETSPVTTTKLTSYFFLQHVARAS